MVYKKLEEFPHNKSCDFCRSRRSDEVELGEIANIADIYCHYFCLLLSNKVVQRGNDNQGILGFMPGDIKKEISRGKSQKCDYCKKSGATIKCSDKKCKTQFHLACGLKKDSLHQFFGYFRSFCGKHRPTQKIPPNIMASAKSCVVCTSPLQRSNTYIWPECCKPSALIHRRCLQRMAMYHGYYFKCPLCNDTKQFLEAARRLGIYIPEQDPTWEREEGAFQELLDRTITCELDSNCLCDYGRGYSRASTKWKLERCSLCGSSGIHLGCSPDWTPGSGFSMSWTCETCSSAESAVRESTVLATESAVSDYTEIQDGPETDHEMEIEVDVETIDDNPQFLLPESYFQPHGSEHLTSKPDPVVRLERRDSLDFLRSDLPIIISDSDDELDVVSISSSEDSSDTKSTIPLVATRPLTRSATSMSMPRPIMCSNRPAANRKILAPAPIPQVSLVTVVAFTFLLGMLVCQCGFA